VGWITTLFTGGVYPAQALLFAYLVTALLNPDIAAMRSRANFLSLWWLIIAIVEFIAYSSQGWGFGYASEKMVRPHERDADYRFDVSDLSRSVRL
jgi:ATP-binding cassette, subfamily B (MDR/TAP), member 1